MAHQSIDRLLRNYMKEKEKSGLKLKLSYEVEEDCECFPAETEDLIVIKSKLKEDKFLAGEKAIEANELLAISFNMNNSFFFGKKLKPKNTTLELPQEVSIAGSPKLVTFPHIGCHSVSMTDTFPLSRYQKGNSTDAILKYKETEYSAKIKVRTVFKGIATFFDENSKLAKEISVSDAIAHHQAKSDQCQGDGSYISLGSCVIKVREFLSVRDISPGEMVEQIATEQSVSQ